MNIISSAFGRYPVSTHTEAADVLLGHSFGDVTDLWSVNRQIADQMLAARNGRPIVVDRMLADAFPGGDKDVDAVAEGPITNAVGQGLGTWGTLEFDKEFMAAEELELALQFGQRNHIGRILMQADKLGIPSIAPDDLPRGFETKSSRKQLVTRKLLPWAAHEIVGATVLKRRGQL